MKRFFKSFIISLMIGIPIIVAVCIFLYRNNGKASLNAVQEENIHLNSFDESENADLDIETDDILSPDDKLVVDSADEAISVTLSFAGDVHFSELAIQNYNKNGISALVDEEMLSFMKESDLFVLNHEFVFSNRGEAMEDKEYTLRTSPEYVKILQELGTDVVGIANNHVLDFGQEAFLDTLNTLENAKISYTGGGRNLAEASTPVIQTINGQTFAIFAATRVVPSVDWHAGKNHPGVFQTYDSTALNKAISEAENKYDHIIVFVHWGIERIEIPEEYQRTLAKGYIDAGADLVIGAHPHVLQGFEYYKGVPICYSLGNYLFGNRTGETLLLNAIFDDSGELSIQLIPCERVNGVLTRIQDPTKLFNHLTDISFGTTVSHGGVLIE